MNCETLINFAKLGWLLFTLSFVLNLLLGQSLREEIKARVKEADLK